MSKRRAQSADNAAQPRTPIDRGHTYPTPLWLDLIRWLCHGLLFSALANAATLLISVVVGIALIETEAFDLPWRVRDGIDEFFRAFLGVSALGGGFGLAIVYAVVRDIHAALLRWHLGRFTEEQANRALVPVDWQRDSYVTKEGDRSLMAQFPGLTILGFTTLVMGPIVGITAIVGAFDGESYAGPSAIAAVVLIIIPLVGAALLRKVPESRAAKFWGTNKAGTFVPANKKGVASPAVARLAVLSIKVDRITTALAVTAVSTFGLTMVATMIVQPCRYCDRRDLNRLGESVVAFVAGSAGVILAVTLIPCVVMLFVHAILRYRLRTTLLAEAADDNATVPPWALLHHVLLQQAPLFSFFLLFHMLGSVIVEIAWTGLILEDPILVVEEETWFLVLRIGIALLACGAFAWWYGRDKAARQKEELMERWDGRRPKR